FWTIPELKIGERGEFEVMYECIAATDLNGARIEASTSVNGQLTRPANMAFEILPAAAAPPESRGAAPGAAAPRLVMQLTPTADRVRAGSRVICTLSLQNQDGVAHNNVGIQILFPNELTPDLDRINASIQQRYNL